MEGKVGKDRTFTCSHHRFVGQSRYIIESANPTGTGGGREGGSRSQRIPFRSECLFYFDLRRAGKHNVGRVSPRSGCGARISVRHAMPFFFVFPKIVPNLLPPVWTH